MPSEPYDTKLLRFYLAKHRYVAYSNVALSIRTSDFVYSNVLIDASERYDTRLLCLASDSVRMLVRMMPRNLDYHTVSYCTKAEEPLIQPASSISGDAMLTSNAKT